MRNPLAINRLLSLFIAPLIWIGHFTLCYVLVSLACIYQFAGARFGVAILTLGAYMLLALAAWFNFHKWQTARESETADASLDVFFAKTSLLLCGLSAVALAWVAFPAALLPTCAA